MNPSNPSLEIRIAHLAHLTNQTLYNNVLFLNNTVFNENKQYRTLYGNARIIDTFSYELENSLPVHAKNVMYICHVIDNFPFYQNES